MVRAIVACLVLLGCSSDGDKPKPKPKTTHEPATVPAEPAPVTLAAGPVPVTLATADAKTVHTLATAKELVVIDSRGALTADAVHAGPTPWVGKPVEREQPTARAGVGGFDGFGVLSDDTTAIAVILADASSPARVVLRDGIRAYPSKPTFLAVNAGNTVVSYRFGEEAWDDVNATRVSVDKLAIPSKLTEGVVLEFTDAATHVQLVAALGAMATRGVKRVRLHRMMGWGGVPPRSVAELKGAAQEDDVFSNDPSVVLDEEPHIDGSITPDAIHTMLSDAYPRFRYCFEMRKPRVKPGSIELAFDVDKNGAISNATAKGVDAAVASCSAGALFDMVVPHGGFPPEGHVVVSITFARDTSSASANTENVSGWWCWSGHDTFGPVGMCAREELQCSSVLYGYSDTMTKLGNEAVKAECKQQKIAWENNDSKPLPTKAMCTALLSKGDTCRAIR